MYASPSARCHASSPSDRPPASGRKSYCVGGSARKSLTVFSASRSHVLRNISSSFIGMSHLLVILLSKTNTQASSPRVAFSTLAHAEGAAQTLEPHRDADRAQNHPTAAQDDDDDVPQG